MVTETHKTRVIKRERKSINRKKGKSETLYNLSLNGL